MKIKILVVLIAFFSFSSVDAAVDPAKLKKMKDRKQLSGARMDCQPSQAQYDMEINNVRARLLTGGDMWWNLDDGRYIVPKPAPGFPEVSAIFAGGIWVGGVDPNGALKLAGVTYRSGNDTDYYAGPLDEEGQTNIDVCEDWDRFFIVKGDNVRTHIKNYDESIKNGETYPCNTIPDDVKYWPARGNPFFGEKYDFELPNQNLADFFDENGDGIYNPCDGDYPIAVQRGCEDSRQIPDEIVYWIFNDNGGPHRLTQATAIQMEVQAQAYAYATTDELNDMTFYRFKMVNKASDDIRDCYFGLWVDVDLGCSEDDYLGCDIDRSMAYFYNEDAVDGNPGSACPGGVQTYGDEVPILGIDLFRGPRGPKVFCGVDADGNKILCDPDPGTGQVDTIVELGMTSFTYQNRGVSNPPEATQDPDIDFEFYNILKGFWKDGTAITFGNTGFDPASADTVKYVFSDAPEDPLGWSMCTQDLPFEDRRTVQSTGPLLLQPGAINEMIFGVVFVPDADYPCPSIAKLQFADDLAQALFDNCFSISETPDAPDMSGVELDEQLILILSNDPSPLVSNNAMEQFMEKDIQAPPGVEDPYYRFEGYKIYQLANANVSTSELDNVDKARLIRQVDLKNGVGDIYNWFPVEDPDPTAPPIWVPARQVAGADVGIQHSFNITADYFSGNSQSLQNGKNYYYTVLAYAYNNYMQYDANEGIGQRNSYIESKRNVKTYKFSPRSLEGEDIPTAYGQETPITRIQGIGTSFNALDMAEGEIESILDGTFDGEITYKAGNGPINPKVVNPIRIKNGSYRLEIVGDYDESPSALQFEEGATWNLIDIGSGEVIASDRTIEEINEQIIPDKGFSIQVNQVGEPGEQFNEDNGAIAQGFEYEDADAVNWWNAIPAYTGIEVMEDGISQFFFPFVDNADEDDPENALSRMGTGQFIPFKSARWEEFQIPFITPGWRGLQGFSISQNKLRLEHLNNVDIVFTPNKSLWSKCIVVESAVEDYLANGLAPRENRDQFELRSDPSIDQDGNQIEGTGMSYFPGYAIDVETGERLNIFFGENSAFNVDNDALVSQATGTMVNTGDIGADMIWNPSSELFVGDNAMNSPVGSYANLVGGQHFIYVTRQEYDECEGLAELLQAGSGLLNKLNGVSFITWTAIPLPQQPLLTLEQGLIPNELTVKLRVTSPFNKEIDLRDNENPTQFETVEGLPVYEFGFEGVETSVSTEEEVPDVFEDIVISPNPFYENSALGQGQSDNIVRMANLPMGSVVTVYTFEGRFIRQMSNEMGSNFVQTGTTQALEWDLNDRNGLRVPSGVYVVNVAVPHLGVQKSMKWIKM